MYNPLQPSNSEKHSSSEGGFSLRISELTEARQSVNLSVGARRISTIYAELPNEQVTKQVVAAEIGSKLNLDSNLGSSDLAQPVTEVSSTDALDTSKVEFLRQTIEDIHSGLGEE